MAARIVSFEEDNLHGIILPADAKRKAHSQHKG
jgi:hypothetical protein